jgi:hypothetical protein
VLNPNREGEPIKTTFERGQPPFDCTMGKGFLSQSCSPQRKIKLTFERVPIPLIALSLVFIIAHHKDIVFTF